jgi:hypothetical protein
MRARPRRAAAGLAAIWVSADAVLILAYLFWHVPLADVDTGDYEAALTGFHRHL